MGASFGVGQLANCVAPRRRRLRKISMEKRMAVSNVTRDQETLEGRRRPPAWRWTGAAATSACELSGAWTSAAGLLRCPRCHGALRRTEIGFDCNEGRCGASLPLRDGVLIVDDDPIDDNKIAADFYDNGQWQKVRVWETLFWLLNGGEKRARDVVLRRLPKSRDIRLLDVAIGDGVYTPGFPRTGRSSASTYRRLSSPTASAAIPAATFNSSRVRRRTCRSMIIISTPC